MVKKSVRLKPLDVEELRYILKDAKHCGCPFGCFHETAREQLAEWAIRYMPRFLAEVDWLRAVKDCHDHVNGELQDADDACKKFGCGGSDR